MKVIGYWIVGEGKFGYYEIGRQFENNIGGVEYWVNRGYSFVKCYVEEEDFNVFNK